MIKIHHAPSAHIKLHRIPANQEDKVERILKGSVMFFIMMSAHADLTLVLEFHLFCCLLQIHSLKETVTTELCQSNDLRWHFIVKFA